VRFTNFCFHLSLPHACCASPLPPLHQHLKYKSPQRIYLCPYSAPLSMPLLEPSPYLAQQIFTFLDLCETAALDSAHAALVVQLQSWAGPRTQQQQRGHCFNCGPPLPFALVKQLHRALCAVSVSLQPSSASKKLPSCSDNLEHRRCV
jgi:hypothetical protein